MNRLCHASRSTICEYARRIAYVCTTTAPEPSSDTVLYHEYTWMTTASLPGGLFANRFHLGSLLSIHGAFGGAAALAQGWGPLNGRQEAQLPILDDGRGELKPDVRADADVLPGWCGGHVRGRNVPFDNTIDNLPWSEMAAYTCRCAATDDH